MQKGVYQEETAGDLNAAIKTYEQIVADERANRPHVAQATYRLGMCYLKQGQRKQAVETFEKLIAEFPKQSLLIERARGALTVLGHVSESGEAESPQSRLVGTFPPATGYPKSLAISSDGQRFVFQDADAASLVVRDLKTGQDRQLAPIVVPVERPNIVWQSHGQSVAISRDGKRVAYNVYDEKDDTAELRIIGIDGSQGRTVFDPEDPVLWISPQDWSPDGKQIVGRLERSDGTRGIVMVAVADGSVKELKSLGKLDSENMSLSPDGRYIAYDFHTGNHRQEDIALLPVTLSLPTFPRVNTR